MQAIRIKAFTLVEMLVVMAIMLILAAILIPALNRAKEFGRAARCGSNLRQLQVAVLNFAGDDGHMPRAYSSWEADASDQWWHQHGWVAWYDVLGALDGPRGGAKPANGNYSWRGTQGITTVTNGSLWPYAAHQDVYLCPTFAMPKVCGQTDAMRNYSMNTNLHRLVLGGAGMSTTVLFGDDRNVTSSLDGAFGTNEVATWHSAGRGHVVYADGRVEKR